MYLRVLVGVGVWVEGEGGGCVGGCVGGREVMQYNVRYSYIRCSAPDMVSSRDCFSHTVAVSVHASVSCHYDWSEHNVSSPYHSQVAYTSFRTADSL